jgi:hypothetical protein
VAKKIVISILLLVLGGLLGVAGGIGVSSIQSAHRRDAPDTPERRRFVASYDVMYRLQMVDMSVQFRLESAQKTLQSKRESLLQELATIQDVKKNLTIPELLPLIEVQDGIAHGRFALLEESCGNTPAFNREMSAAQEAFKAAGWTNPTEQIVRKVVADTDLNPKTAVRPGKS